MTGKAAARTLAELAWPGTLVSLSLAPWDPRPAGLLGTMIGLGMVIGLIGLGLRLESRRSAERARRTGSLACS